MENNNSMSFGGDSMGSEPHKSSKEQVKSDNEKKKGQGDQASYQQSKRFESKSHIKGDQKAKNDYFDSVRNQTNNKQGTLH